MLPSSSRDAWTAHATFSKLPEAKWRENWQKNHFICFDFQKTLHSRDVFYTISRRFVRLGFRLNCARLAVHYFAVYLVLGSF